MTLGVADGLARTVLALAGQFVEPVDEVVVVHDRPLAPGQHDGTAGLGHGAGDDTLSHRLHPPVVLWAVRELALAHAVTAVDAVELAVAMVPVDLRPADAVGTADRGGRPVDRVGLLVTLHPHLAVEGVGPLAARERVDTGVVHLVLLAWMGIESVGTVSERTR